MNTGTVADDRDPRLALDWAEVAGICDLLQRAAALLTLEDGCCHQFHHTERWRESQLIDGWLTDLTTNLHQLSAYRSVTLASECRHALITGVGRRTLGHNATVHRLRHRILPAETPSFLVARASTGWHMTIYGCGSKRI